LIDEFKIDVMVTTFHSLAYKYVRKMFDRKKCVVVDYNLREKIFYDYLNEIFKEGRVHELVDTFNKTSLGNKYFKYGTYFLNNYSYHDSYDSFFEDYKIISAKVGLLPGSGVNLEKYQPLPYPEDDKIIFTYIARVMKTKGIDEFLAAAETIKKEYSNVEFHICGYYEDDYKDIIEQAQKQGTIVYHGMVNDVRPYEEISHCIVLPTYHPEGISNVLLEAAACARPIITTNRPGCKEVVDDGINGYLVKEKDSQDLIRKMRQFMELSWEARRDMGLAGRSKVEKEFDRQIVVEKYLEYIQNI
jgi:galacturonosyltransferase